MEARTSVGDLYTKTNLIGFFVISFGNFNTHPFYFKLKSKKLETTFSFTLNEAYRLNHEFTAGIQKRFVVFVHYERLCVFVCLMTGSLYHSEKLALIVEKLVRLLINKTSSNVKWYMYSFRNLTLWENKKKFKKNNTHKKKPQDHHSHSTFVVVGMFSFLVRTLSWLLCLCFAFFFFKTNEWTLADGACGQFHIRANLLQNGFRRSGWFWLLNFCNRV